MSTRSYYARKVFELSGVLPIGAFLIEHLYSNFQAVGPGGAERFDKVVVDLQTNPAIIYAEIAAIGLPLLYHAGYGLFVMRIARPNAGAYGYLRNWTYVLQRLTGLFLLGYIAYHVYNTRLYPLWHPDDPLLQHAGGEALVSSRYMHDYLAGAHGGVPVLWIYVAGLSCACFHFGNGLWNLAVHWGLVVGREAQRRAFWLTLGVGATLFYLGLRAILAFVEMG